MDKTQSTRRLRSRAGVRMTLSAAALCWASGEAAATTGLPPPLPFPTGSFTVTGGGHGAGTTTPTPSAFCSAAAETLEASLCSTVIKYEFRVNGPSGASATLTIGAFAAFFAGGVVDGTRWSASADVRLGNAPVVAVPNSKCTPGATSCEATSGFFLATVLDNAVNLISVEAFANVNNDFVGTQAVTDVLAFADPQISFAPGFDSTGLTLQFSPGVGDGPPRDSMPTIPEPGTLTLVGVGAAGLFARAWRRRTPSAA
jgi:hypothetical protein